MTPAETPTECSTPRLRGRILGPNHHTCKEVNEMDARIRELEGVLGRVRWWFAQGDMGQSYAIEEAVKAALARSEGGGA